MDLVKATEVFVHGFCVCKSQAHPYLAEKVNGLWVMKDGPGRKIPRKIEVAAVGFEPSEVLLKIRSLGIGWHFLCHVHELDEDFEEIRNTYKTGGYRAMSTEWLFVHDLYQVLHFDSVPPVLQLDNQPEVDAVPQRAKHKRKLIPGTRLYAAWDETTDYGWVESIPAGRNAWVANLYVHREARGSGYGRALMSKLLQVDKESGVETSVLLASSDGARLYPHLGYRKVGVLQMFCPVSRDD